MYQPPGVTTSAEFPIPDEAGVPAIPISSCCEKRRYPFLRAPTFWSGSTPLQSAPPISRDHSFGLTGQYQRRPTLQQELHARPFDATKIHTHTLSLVDLPTALRCASERLDNAIKVVVTNRRADAVTDTAAE